MVKIFKDYGRIILINDNENYIENKKNEIIIRPFFGKNQHIFAY